MRTVRCSGRCSGPGGACTDGVSSRGSICLGGEGVSARVSAWRGCSLPQCKLGYTPPVDRILDARLWKHYLSATSLRKVTRIPVGLALCRVNVVIPHDVPKIVCCTGTTSGTTGMTLRITGGHGKDTSREISWDLTKFVFQFKSNPVYNSSAKNKVMWEGFKYEGCGSVSVVTNDSPTYPE